MAEAYFNIKNRGVLRVRLEPTDIFGAGNAVFPTLTLQLKLQLLPAQLDSIVNYTLVRLAGKLSVANENTELATFESSSPGRDFKHQLIRAPVELERSVKHQASETH